MMHYPLGMEEPVEGEAEVKAANEVKVGRRWGKWTRSRQSWKCGPRQGWMRQRSLYTQLGGLEDTGSGYSINYIAY